MKDKTVYLICLKNDNKEGCLNAFGATKRQELNKI
jgi:hypothetical protein